MLTVDIIRDVAADSPNDQQLSTWVRAAYSERLDIQSTGSNAEVSLKLVDENAIQELNKQYRDKDRATNVLSFANDDEPMSIDWGELGGEQAPIEHYGDIVLCAPYIEREAAEQNKNRIAHWAHMVIHGALHLQGYDHIDDNDAVVMEQIEVDTLQTLGFSNPYLSN